MSVCLCIANTDFPEKHADEVGILTNVIYYAKYSIAFVINTPIRSKQRTGRGSWSASVIPERNNARKYLARGKCKIEGQNRRQTPSFNNCEYVL